jgi:hypothetical protein
MLDLESNTFDTSHHIVFISGFRMVQFSFTNVGAARSGPGEIAALLLYAGSGDLHADSEGG